MFSKKQVSNAKLKALASGGGATVGKRPPHVAKEAEVVIDFALHARYKESLLNSALYKCRKDPRGLKGTYLLHVIDDRFLTLKITKWKGLYELSITDLIERH